MSDIVSSTTRPSTTGTIYGAGTQTGSVFRYNKIHDIDPAYSAIYPNGGAYGSGLYLDEDCDSILAEKNWIYRVPWGLKLHLTNDNVIRNNVFAAIDDLTFVWFAGSNDRLTGNIYCNTLPTTYTYKSPAGSLNYNLFYNTDAGFQATWHGRINNMRVQGFELNSIEVDPQFVDYGNDNFNLRASSPALRSQASGGIGFQQIDMSTVGPRTGGYTLAVTAANGSVVKNPDKSSYAYNESVRLTAAPQVGYTFTGWSGALTGTTNPATLVMNSNKSVTAHFISTGGTTETVGNTTVYPEVSTLTPRCAAPCTMAEAGQLQSISIYHQGGSGQMILGVYADSSGRPGTRLGVTSSTAVNGSEAWQTVALQSPVSVSSGQKLWLAWVFQSNPGIRYRNGSPGRALSGALWTSGMPTSFGASSVANYTYSIYANYSPQATGTTYTLTTSATNGTITRTPNKTSYTSGETVSLRATPNAGYTFSGWSGALTATTNPVSLVMNSNKSVTANFTSSGGTNRTVGNTTVFPEITDFANRRAAPYTMSEAGTLQSISIYHQGGSGQGILAVYGDSAGKPGSRLGVTASTPINRTAGWQTVALQNPVSVSAGQKIWLAWVFQYNPGVRFTSGAAGRAQANATWSGGMPTTFGASTVDNYIYSIYATYRSGSGTTAASTLAAGSAEDAVTETAVETQMQSQPMGHADADYGSTARTRRSAGPADAGEPQGDGAAPAADLMYAPELGRSLCLDRIGANQGKPATVTDAQGNVWVLWHAGDADKRQIYAAGLSPDGKMCRGTVQLSGSEGDHCNPAVTIDGTGTLCVVWQENARGVWDVCVSTSADGHAWSAPARITDSDEDNVNPAIAAGVQPSALVAVAWQGGPAGKQDIYVACSMDAFASVEVSQVTADAADQTDPAVAIDAQDTVTVLWTDRRNGSSDIYGAASDNGPWVNLPVVNIDSNQGQPAIAVGPMGRVLHILWVDDIGGDPDIFYVASEGLPTSPLTCIDIIDDAFGANQQSPDIAVTTGPDGAERVLACWVDGRNGNADPYCADLSAGAARTNVPLDDGGTASNQREVALGTDWLGRPYLVWTDDAGGSPQVFYAGPAGQRDISPAQGQRGASPNRPSMK